VKTGNLMRVKVSSMYADMLATSGWSECGSCADVC
jgi:hypothetical protein